MNAELNEIHFLSLAWGSPSEVPCFTQERPLLPPVAYRPEATVGVEVSDSSVNCIEQTTEWSACSRSCGMGFSTRVTNRNRQCDMVKQTRLCMVRPCEPEPEQPAEKVGLGSHPREGSGLASLEPALRVPMTPGDSEVSAGWAFAPDKRHSSSGSQAEYLLVFLFTVPCLNITQLTADPQEGGWGRATKILFPNQEGYRSRSALGEG